MNDWTLAPARGEGPVFLQLGQTLIDDIRRGRLKPGQRLPGSRTLAIAAGVNRNTVIAALDELTAQGWLTATPAKGTFVSTELPDATRPRGEARLNFALPPAPKLSSMSRDWEPTQPCLYMSAGSPDPKLFPVDELARAWRRVVRRSNAKLLSYGHPAGEPRLRAALAELVSSRRGVAAEAPQVLVTRGSQMALDLCARGLLRPGETVAVESLGYRPAWDALTQAGARLLPIPVDGDGLQVEVLEQACARQPIRAVYVTPHHQYPTTTTLSAARRLKLLELARAKRLIVLEDDYDHEFHFEGRPVLPLASVDEGNVVYLGTLSKVLAPGLRLGFIVAAPEVVTRLTAIRAVMDRQGDHPMEAAVAELIEDGELQRHMRRMRSVYWERRDALAEALKRECGDALSFDVPAGGIALWAKLARGIDESHWRAECLKLGIHVAPSQQFSIHDKSIHATRLSYCHSNVAKLKDAAKKLSQALS